MRIPPPSPREYRQVACPKCGADVGEPCVSTNGSGNRAPLTHVWRRQDYFARQASTAPTAFVYAPEEPV